MYRSLLVPLDGSPFAEQALPMALSLARRAGASVNVVLVHVPFTAAYADSISPGTCEAKAEGYLHRVAERLQQQGHAVQTQAVPGQHPASAILEAAQAAAVDLIALETHGRRGLRRLLMGSVADKVIRGASVPVLVHRSPTA